MPAPLSMSVTPTDTFLRSASRATARTRWNDCVRQSAHHSTKIRSENTSRKECACIPATSAC